MAELIRSTSSAPQKSSHLGCMLRVILDWAPISEGTMGSSFVVPVDPFSNDPPRVLNCLERVLPDTLVSYILRKNRSISPFCSGLEGVRNSCRSR